jgi:hypothetical protein
MAIDTREKRQAAGGVPFLPNGPNVTPNASKDVEWRQQSAHSYSGILPSGAPAPTARVLQRPGLATVGYMMVTS